MPCTGKIYFELNIKLSYFIYEIGLNLMKGHMKKKTYKNKRIFKLHAKSIII